MLYREAWRPLAVGLQMQNRSLTVNDRHWADAYSGSLVLGKLTDSLSSLPITGCATPFPIQPSMSRKVDAATIVGAGDWFDVGSTFAISISMK